jgi:uncharacterized protein YjbI with pentapeptide repeats
MKKLKKITEKELKEILENHKLWVESEGKSGSRANLSDVDLSYANLSFESLIGADLSGADLSGAKLRDSDLSGADLSGADLSYAKLVGTDLSGANLAHANLKAADLSSADLSGADLSSANLAHANLNSIKTAKTNLSNTDLSFAYLGYADLSGADLSGADLLGADLRYESELKPFNVIRNHVEWLQSDHKRGARADLRGMCLRDFNLSCVDLSGADLRGADLRGINLKGCRMTGADLREADLRGVDLSGCNMDHADLRNADLRGVELNNTSLGYSNLEGIQVDSTTNFDFVDLEDAKISTETLSFIREYFRRGVKPSPAPITGWFLERLGDGRSNKIKIKTTGRRVTTVRGNTRVENGIIIEIVGNSENSNYEIGENIYCKNYCDDFRQEDGEGIPITDEYEVEWEATDYYMNSD